MFERVKSASVKDHKEGNSLFFIKNQNLKSAVIIISLTHKCTQIIVLTLWVVNQTMHFA